MYEMGGDQDKIYESDLSTAWDPSTATFNQSKSTAEGYKPRSIFFKPDGKKLYHLDDSQDKIYEYNLSTAWDISTASLKQSITFDKGSYGSGYGLFFREDGKKMYAIAQGAEKIYEYNLSTAWDISTASEKQSIGTNYSDPTDLFFREDGKKMYVVSRSGRQVTESDLSTAWDISTATVKHSVTAQGGSGGVNGVFFGKT